MNLPRLVSRPAVATAGPGAAPSVGASVRRETASVRALAALLLAAIVSSVLVVADMLVDAWADGHLLLAWVSLWIVAFAGLALLAGTVRRFSEKLMAEMDAWAARRAERRASERLWAIARADARVMSELQAALRRDDATVFVASHRPTEGASVKGQSVL